MNTRSLEYLVALSTEGSFSAAADRCGVSQATVSGQIRKLEDELGVDLVDRSLRTITFTRIGEQVLDVAQAVLERVNKIETLASSAKDPKTSTLKFALFPTVGPYLLPHIMDGISDAYPELRLQLVEEKSDVIEQSLIEGSVDLAVLALPTKSKLLQTQSLFDEDFVLAVPANHSLGSAQKVIPADLNYAELMLLTEGHCLRDHALDFCNLNSPGGFEATSLETLRHMVGAGNGITLMPKLAVTPPTQNPKSVRIIEFEEPAPSRELGLVWKRNHPHQKFFTELGDKISQLVS